MDSPRRLFDIVDIQLEKFPKDDMLCMHRDSGWQRYGTREVRDIVDKLSCGLLSIGVGNTQEQPEDIDKVVVISANRPEWMMLDIAVQQVGAVLVPIYPTTSPNELVYILQETAAKYIFISDELILNRFSECIESVPTVSGIYTFDKTSQHHWEYLLLQPDVATMKKINNIRASIHSERLATIIYTSGTTGLPKGVMLSHKNIISNILIDKAEFPFPDAPHYRTVSFLPLNHVFERVANYFYMLSGVGIYYIDQLDKIGELIREVKPHVFTSVPRLLEKVFEKIMTVGYNLKGAKKALFFWSVILASKYDNRKNMGWWYNFRLVLANKLVFSKWRKALGGNVEFILVGGAACQERLLRVFHAARIPVYEGYGPTENSPVISANKRTNNDVMFGTVGVPFGGQEVKLSEEGEVCVKGPCVMMGYYKNPELTAETVIDGWLHTGDIGVWVENKFLKITDRKKEIFKTSGGKYVAPLPIENKLKESLLVEHAMILGDGEKFVSALIVPAFDSLRSYMERKGLSFTSIENALQHPDIQALYHRIVEKANAVFNKVEQVKKFKLLCTDWGVDTGELSPKLSLKRKAIVHKYASEIQELYSS